MKAPMRPVNFSFHARSHEVSAWCFIFFGSQNFVAALIELICMLIVVVMMAVFFRKVDPTAAWLQVPYVLWLCFATYLNLGVVLLNG